MLRYRIFQKPHFIFANEMCHDNASNSTAQELINKEIFTHLSNISERLQKN